MQLGLISKEELIREIRYAIDNSELAAFVRAGISSDAGFKLWKDMLKDPAKKLNLNIDREQDLLSVARFCYQTNTKIFDYLTLMPFPTTSRDKKSLLKLWDAYREEMISQCGIGIFISGNKVIDGNIINANGMIKEYEIAENNDLVNIPLKFTGVAAKELYEDN